MLNYFPPLNSLASSSTWYNADVKAPRPTSIAGRNLRYDFDLTPPHVWQIFRTAKRLKSMQKSGKPHELLKGKSLAMIFEKPSTRTRVSFEVGMTELGGHALFLGPNDLQLSRGETIADTARVLSRYVDAIMARVYKQETIEELARFSTVPVINGLSDRFHPCQALTDIFTVWEKRESLNNLTMTFIGDGDNNVTNSLLLLSSRLGINFTITCPKIYNISQDILKKAQIEAKQTGSRITVTTDTYEAVKHADAIYTDVWVSMGRSHTRERKKALHPYQVNKKLLAQAPKGALVMHCLPAHRGEEITDEVIDSAQSIVFEQAENRLHVQKALLSLLIS